MAASTDEYNEAYVRDLLQEVVRSLKSNGGKVPKELRGIIVNMLGLVDPLPEQTSTVLSSDIDTTSDKSAKISARQHAAETRHSSTTDECVMCSLEDKGTYTRRGFKCVRCYGIRNNAGRDFHHSVNYSRNPHFVPSCLKDDRTSFFDPVDLDRLALQEHVFDIPVGGEHDASEPSQPNSQQPSRKSSIRFRQHHIADESSGASLQSTPRALALSPMSHPKQEAKNIHRYSFFWTSLDPSIHHPRFRSTLLSFSHPNVAYLYSVSADQKMGVMYYVTEACTPIFRSSLLCSEIESVDSDCSKSGDERHLALRPLFEDHETLRRVVASTLQGLNALHCARIVHGDLRMHNILVDAFSVVKLRPMVLNSLAHLPPIFLPPETKEQGTTAPTAATDLYVLGMTLSLLAFGTVGPPFPKEANTHTDTMFVKLLSTLMHPLPDKRGSAALALEHEYLQLVRVIRGIPVESITFNISKEEENCPYYSCLNPEKRGSALLENFFLEQGPAFQLVKGPTSVSLYSVKSDPRRKRAVVIGAI